MSALVSRLDSLADCDSRAGEPLGKCMREASAEIKRLCAALQSIAEMTDIEADFDGFEAREIARAALARGESQ